IVFAVSSVLMAASIIWMIADDHFREWKRVQRDFIRLDADKTKQEMEAARELASKQEMNELKARREEARKAAEPQARAAQADIDAVLGKVQLVDQQKAFKKASRDSIQSFYDKAVEENHPDDIERDKNKLAALDDELDRLQAESEQLHAQ